MKKKNLRLSFDAVRSVVATATAKDAGVVFAGNLISATMGAIFYFLLARLAGPANFGVFSVVVAAAVMATDLFDIAINSAVINFGSVKEERGVVLRAALKRKVVFTVLVFGGLVILAPLIMQILGRPELVGQLRLAALLVPGKALFSFVRAAMQAARKFVVDAAVDVLSTVIRLGLFLWGALVIGGGWVEMALVAYVGGLVLSAVVVMGMVLAMMRGARRGKVSEFSEFQSWMTVSFMSSAVAGKLDVFFLTRMTSLEVVGWYQAAFRLFAPVQQLASSLSRVLAPRYASFSKAVQARKYLKKGLMLSIGLAGSMLLVLPLLKWAVGLFYGPTFSQTTELAYWLIGYFMVFILATPVWSKLLYFHSNAKAYAGLAAVQLGLLFVLFPLSIVWWGAAGVPVSLIAVNLLSVSGAWWVMR